MEDRLPAAAQGDSVHLQLAGQDGGLAAVACQEMAQRHGFQFIVNLAVGEAGFHFLVQPAGQRGVQLGARGGAVPAGGVADFAGQMMGQDHRTAGDGGGVFEGVAQFADIARPIVGAQCVEGGR